MGKKKLLIATDNFLPRWDGIARFLKEIIPRIDKEFEITVIAPKFDGDMPEIKNITLVRIPLSRYKVGDYPLPKLKGKLIKEYVKKADIVWTQTIGPIGIPAMWYARKLGKKLIAYVHSAEWELFSRSIKRGRLLVEYFIKILIPFLYNKCDLLMIPYADMSDVIRQRLIFTRKEVVHLGTNTEKFIPSQNKIKSKEEISIDPKKFTIGYIGRIGREKDLKTLYKAFRKVNAEIPNTQLLIVGSGIKLDFDDITNIINVGQTNKVISYYQALDVYVLPSLTETTSLTTMEAMSCGIPVIVTPVGFVKEYIKDKQNGLVFPTENDDKLELLLKKLISDQNLRAKLSREGRKTILQRFTWDKTALNIKQILLREVEQKNDEDDETDEEKETHNVLSKDGQQISDENKKTN